MILGGRPRSNPVFYMSSSWAPGYAPRVGQVPHACQRSPHVLGVKELPERKMLVSILCHPCDMVVGKLKNTTYCFYYVWGTALFHLLSFVQNKRMQRGYLQIEKFHPQLQIRKPISLLKKLHQWQRQQRRKPLNLSFFLSLSLSFVSSSFLLSSILVPTNLIWCRLWIICPIEYK